MAYGVSCGGDDYLKTEHFILKTMTEKRIKTTNDIDFEIKSEDFPFKYQENLTPKLDAITREFDQNIINEIVLWKVNRYAGLSKDSLTLINSISTSSEVINEELTKDVLSSLIAEPGIQLPMASTILRFRNPKIYQIIDQRVYRILFGEKYKQEKDVANQIEKYLGYLKKIRKESTRLGISFEKADRILYLLDKDKRLNGNLPLDNYGYSHSTPSGQD